MKHNKSRTIIFVIMALLGFLVLIPSCNRKRAVDKGVALEKTDTVAQRLTFQMEELYEKVNHVTIAFDSCRAYRQSNGYTILVAVATKENGEMTVFAAPANPEGTEIQYIGEFPMSVATFTGLHIENYLPPIYDGEYAWNLDDEKLSLLGNPTFRSSVMAYRP
jgi:hypothetical protein